ncbi:NAD-dependent protein deacetylase [Arthrobacter sp. 35W]|uniref:NAD-dependent protein deacetylase n=1 Tax=Arthrobacter sp. 35W TaxID=1132441 RepID=UPI0003FDE83C|nr:NAD-dependent protein deacetylase [Arthrobacter sp. 35W]
MADAAPVGIGFTGFARGPAAGHVPEPTGAELETLAEITALLAGRRIALLTGAGLSTDSGIPDYRGPDSAPRNPMTYQEFVGSAALRQRYWARNHLGWRTVRQASPNAGHFAVARLERAGLASGIITQNVDRLHQGAGAENVVDLHGRFDQVICLRCGHLVSRAELADVLDALNPGFLAAVNAHGGVESAPDADATLEAGHLIESFHVADCPVCGGVLKPDVVFFGENVPKPRVERAYAMVDDAGALLVAGSSLTVMSGLRFVRHAAKAGKPVVVINRGTTRGDDVATVKFDAGTSMALVQLERALAQPGPQPGSGRPDW